MKKVITKNLFAVFFSVKKSFKETVFTLVILSTFPLGASALSPGDQVRFKRDVLTLEEMLDEVSSQLKCDVFYSEDEFDGDRKVRLPRRQLSLDELLRVALPPEILLHDKGWGYRDLARSWRHEPESVGDREGRERGSLARRDRVAERDEHGCNDRSRRSLHLVDTRFSPGDTFDLFFRGDGDP